MMLATVEAWAAILGAIVAASTFAWSMVRAGRAERDRQDQARIAQLRQAREEGRASRDDEVALLRSQRDDARVERDRLQRRDDAQQERDRRRERDDFGRGGG